MKMTANYHNHTYRCGHASGKDEQYVEAALRNGMEEMGFSDHVILPDFRQPGMRGAPEEAEGYYASIRSLAEKYRDQIAIHVGYEAEWYGECYAPYYRELLRTNRVDYLILGQHGFMEREGKFVWYDDLPLTGEAWLERYVRDLVDGIHSGLFSYVAHPDIFVYWRHCFSKRAAREIALAAKEEGIPLEINMSGTRVPGYVLGDPSYPFYPYPPFWDVVAETGCEVILGVDAHSPRHYDIARYDDYLRFCEERGLRVVERLNFKKGK